MLGDLSMKRNRISTDDQQKKSHIEAYQNKISAAKYKFKLLAKVIHINHSIKFNDSLLEEKYSTSIWWHYSTLTLSVLTTIIIIDSHNKKCPKIILSEKKKTIGHQKKNHRSVPTANC